MRALLYPPSRICYTPSLYPYDSAAPCFSVALPPACSCSPLGEHYVQALVMRVSFFWDSVGGVPHISVILVKFLTVPLNRQIKVLYHGIESISR